MVIIAKRIHLFPFRTQKLSSLALMVLGGQPPGRVGRSHVMCRGSSMVEHRLLTDRLRVRPLHPHWQAQLESVFRNIKWPIGQAVKTPPFHGGNRGSIPLWVTNIPRDYSSAGRAPALQAGGHRFEPC